MLARARRGVCLGVGSHLAAGAIADIDEPLFRYLKSIGAVEAAPPGAVLQDKAADASETKLTPAKPGKKD